ncbi:DUF669 domain-containing protein [Listeria monocytogenes]|nr:DUF669 domain-containing protein [Listeria monocytogenes]
MSTPFNYRVNHQNKLPETPKVTKNGEYEVKIIGYEVRTTKHGDPMLCLTHLVRDDVQQEGQNAKIRYDNLTFKEQMIPRIDALSTAAMIPQDREFQTIEELADNLVGKCIRVNVYMKKMDQGTYPRVKSHLRTNHVQAINGEEIPKVSDFITEYPELEQMDDLEEDY